jgi:hypothetical protein
LIYVLTRLARPALSMGFSPRGSANKEMCLNSAMYVGG